MVADHRDRLAGCARESSGEFNTVGGLALCDHLTQGTVGVAGPKGTTGSVRQYPDCRIHHVTPRLLTTMTTSGDGLDASVGAAVDGDPRAIGRLLAFIRPMVVRYCRARVGRQERTFASADDVAQEV